MVQVWLKVVSFVAPLLPVTERKPVSRKKKPVSSRFIATQKRFIYNNLSCRYCEYLIVRKSGY